MTKMTATQTQNQRMMDFERRMQELLRSRQELLRSRQEHANKQQKMKSERLAAYEDKVGLLLEQLRKKDKT